MVCSLEQSTLSNSYGLTRQCVTCFPTWVRASPQMFIIHFLGADENLTLSGKYVCFSSRGQDSPSILETGWKKKKELLLNQPLPLPMPVTQ